MASRASDYIKEEGLSMQIIHEVRKEFSELHKKLVERNIKPIVITQYVHDDTPLATFPSHILTTHSAHETQSGKSAFIWHSMKDASRRKERKERISNLLDQFYDQEIRFYENHEQSGRFLEGAASLMFDRFGSVAYILTQNGDDSQSNVAAAQDLTSNHLKYDLVELTASESAPKDMLTHRALYVADRFAVVCFEALSEESGNQLRESLCEKEIIEISLDQAKEMATSMSLLSGYEQTANKRFLITSSSALDVLEDHQMERIRKLVDEVVPVDVKITEERAQLGLDTMICPMYLS